MKIDATRAAPGWQFASDNTAGICPEAWAALQVANTGHAPSYGADAWTERACALLRVLFEHDSAEVFFVFNGTAANSLSLAALTRSYQAIVCHEAAHVQTDECGAPEFFSGGAKLLPLRGAGAKLSADAVLQAITQRDDLHFSRPRALSLSQPTEWGTLYRPDEIAALSAVAHAHGVAVQMDGARFANALAALPGVTAADLSWRVGVDVLSLGGTKNGLNTTEAVVFFNPVLAAEFDYRGKQAGQLASKMRFQSSQWQGGLEIGGPRAGRTRIRGVVAPRSACQCDGATPGRRDQRSCGAAAGTRGRGQCGVCRHGRDGCRGHVRHGLAFLHALGRRLS